MRALIVEDEFTSRRLLENILAPYAEGMSVTNGEEAVAAFAEGLAEGRPFDLVCMDIMMPAMDGQQAVRTIRQLESASGVKPADEAKIIMITALDDPKNVVSAYYRGGAAAYLTKPINVREFLDLIRDMGLIL
ncbi:MAG TPA: response regulator [Desulfovibrio sp.]|jgi:two-component system chemotaxis response regulator CheY|uniref:response regulator n=1 Tax=Desulfovibrio TaxID=872 RepID=UPI000410A791|nr:MULTISPECIES: response regulator [Desulfovibrio]MDY0306926.1 response regulator [Desulfovibrionaceae bacterium]HMM37354.1 response regulator [Desulfovibrio sp.]